jgi:adenylate cyclase
MEGPENHDSASILVVDDTVADATLLSDLLENEGYRATSVASGQAALAALTTQGFDLILLDVVMPDVDGNEVCRRIRSSERFAALPIVMVTSLDAKEERVKGIEAGADDFLSKPINHAELLARVRSLLRIKRLHDRTQQQAEELSRWARTLEERVTQGIAQVERLSRLKRFFSPHLADLIVNGEADDPLKSRRREIVVVYLDLRGFTAFSEVWEPEEVMRTLSAYHAAMGRIVLEHEATLERFTGDGMMVFIGDPIPVERPAAKAVSLALAMHETALALSATWKRRGVDLGLAIGVAQGFATVGTIGFEGRLDYGAIGTVTNLACRLCQLASAGEVLLSQRVYSEVEDTVDAADLGEVSLHGFSRSVRVFRCLGLRETQSNSLPRPSAA